MRPRFLASLLVPATALALFTGAASAQTAKPPDQPHGQAIEPMQPPKELPRAQKGDRTRNLDFLFGALKAAPDADSAKLVEGRIWALWLATGSDSTDLLISLVKAVLVGNDNNLAIELQTPVIGLKPEYIQAWNKHATLYFANKDYSKSLADIRQVLAREPRHFGALSGLGIIMQEFGEDKLALEAFRRAVAVNPHLPKIPEFVKTLTEKVEGRDI